MLSEEQKKILKSKGFSDDKIREFDDSYDRMRESYQKTMDRADSLSSEDIRKMAEQHERAIKEQAIELWKQFKYKGIWPFISIDNPELTQEIQVSPYTALYNYFKEKIGDDIDDL